MQEREELAKGTVFEMLSVWSPDDCKGDPMVIGGGTLPLV